MAKKYTTKLLPKGFLATVCTQFGSPTDYKVLVPYNSPKQFSIGSLSFEVRQAGTGKHYAYAQGELPQSWFINLNEA